MLTVPYQGKFASTIWFSCSLHKFLLKKKNSLFYTLEVLYLSFTFKSMIDVELIFSMWCKIRIRVYYFVCQYPIVPTSFVERTIRSSLSCFRSMTKIYIVYVCVYFWALYFIQMFYFYILLPIMHCIHCCSFIISLEIKYC